MPQTNTTFKRALWLFLAAFSGAIWLCVGVYLYLSPKLPAVEVLLDVRLQTPLRVYTSDGELIGQFGEQKRNPLNYEDIPPLFTRALLAAEDDGFFEHRGIDFPGLTRAVVELVVTGEKGSGGSTLTMQVARNFFLTLERTYTRKFNEILLALEIERKLTKEQIFELYFNQMFLGHRAYGFEAAAQVYYGKHIGDLDLAQLAMIAGLPKAPSKYNPLSNPGRSTIRRDWILNRMLSLGYIDQPSFEEAINSPVTASHHGAKLSFDAPYVAEMVRQEMISKYGLGAYNDGYRVYTTVDSHLQKAADAALINSVAAYDQRHGFRGPEGNYDVAVEDPEGLLIAWTEVLSSTPAIAQWHPAIVTELNEDSFDVLTHEGLIQTLMWEDNSNFARPYITVNARGRRPSLPSDALSRGDLIRITTDESGKLSLSQLPEAQAALVALRPDDGAILSLVGGYGFRQSKFNRVIQARRLPGSNFKPFIYAAALEHGMTAATVINDAPIVIDDSSLETTWRPENDGGKFYGPTRLRWALTQSRNLVSIRLLQKLGIENAVNYVDRFGFDAELLPRNLSLALGTYAVTPLELITGYASLANGGFKVEPHLIDRIEDIRGATVYEAKPATVCRDCDKLPKIEITVAAPPDPAAEMSMEAILSDTALPPVNENGEEVRMEDILQSNHGLPPAERIVEARTAYIIDSILRDVITRGTGRKALSLKRGDIGGKTGTTNGPTDAWFSGFNGDVVATAWVGFDDNRPLGRNEYGGSAALPIWIEYMESALGNSPETERPAPPGLVHARIDPTSGKLARPGQSDAIFEMFRAEFAPVETTKESVFPVNDREGDNPVRDLF